MATDKTELSKRLPWQLHVPVNSAEIRIEELGLKKPSIMERAAAIVSFAERWKRSLHLYCLTTMLVR